MENPISPLVKSMQRSFEKSFTIEYPDDREVLPDNYRGIHRLDMKTCISCSACERICPNQTIVMVDVGILGEETKKMPQINLERCLFCALCEEVCPTKCLVLTKNTDLEAYDRRSYVKRPEDLE